MIRVASSPVGVQAEKTRVLLELEDFNFTIVITNQLARLIIIIHFIDLYTNEFFAKVRFSIVDLDFVNEFVVESPTFSVAIKLQRPQFVNIKIELNIIVIVILVLREAQCECEFSKFSLPHKTALSDGPHVHTFLGSATGAENSFSVIDVIKVAQVSQTYCSARHLNDTVVC